MGQLAQAPQIEFILTVLSGSDKGATYKLATGRRITLGRGSDNDIAITNDPKVSRNHATIVISGRGGEISDVSDRNTVIVNGQEVTTMLLPPGAIIQLGETKFQFKAVPQSSALTTDRAGIEETNATSRLDVAKKRRSPRLAVNAGKKNFYITLVIVALFFIWLLTSNTNKQTPVEIRSEEDVQTDINANRKIVEATEAEKRRLGTNTDQFGEAQPNFIKGFRDYRKGQYERAIESFQACLSLFPAHAQCQRYLRLSQKKFSELVQYHMVLANKYRSQNQFAACKASYRNVMVMMKNAGDKIYVEAKAGYDACHALEGDRY